MDFYGVDVLCTDFDFESSARRKGDKLPWRRVLVGITMMCTSRTLAKLGYSIDWGTGG